MRYLIITCIILSQSVSIKAQTELNIIKQNNDLFEIYFTKKPVFEMNKSYEFIVKTNIKKEDSLYINLDSSKRFIENLFTFEYSFSHHICKLELLKKTAQKSKIKANLLINDIRGVKYVLKIDGKQYFRHDGGKIYSNSDISIQFVSDLYEISEIEIKDPITIIWYKNQKEYNKYYLSDNKLSINYKKLRGLKRLSEEQKRDVFIIFPQAYYKGIPLLPEKKSHRMAVLLFAK